MSILITAAANSDPIGSNKHEGPIMQIMRKYRPDKVYLLLTNEIAQNVKVNHWIEYMEEYINEHWNYYPEIIEINIDTDDPDLLEDVAKKIHVEFRKIVMDRENINEEIYVNLSSGTNAMQTVFQIETLETPYKGIQVRNAFKRSSNKIPTSEKILDGLNNNLDNDPKNNNRCNETNLDFLQNDRNRLYILERIRRYNYEALIDFPGLINTEIYPLIEHLVQRTERNYKEARNKISELKGIGITEEFLYPYNRSNESIDEELERKIIEHFLLMQNDLKKHDANDFLINLNPFLVNLVQYWTKRYLNERKKNYKEYFKKTKRGGVTLSKKLLEEDQSDFLYKLDKKFGWQRFNDEVPFSVATGYKVLQIINKTNSKFRPSNRQLDFFKKLNQLNDYRNQVAHEMENYTVKEMLEKVSINSKDNIDKGIQLFLDRLVRYLELVFPSFNKRLLEVYDKSNEYIRSYLDDNLE